MAWEPPFPRARRAGAQVPGEAALPSRRGPAWRLIGTFAALCQFSKKWSDMMRRMGRQRRNQRV